MIQELFRIGPLPISPFGPMMVLAFLVAWAQLRWGIRRLGVGDDEDASALLLAAGIGGIVGAKIYYSVLYRDWRLFFDRSGLVWYGGFFLGTICLLWVIRRRRLPRWRTLDAVAPSVALGYAVGRIGCFLVGDDYGYPTSLPWGVKFKYGLPGPTTAGFLRGEYGADIPFEVPADELVAVHPTQLYETGAGLFIGALGFWLVRRGAKPGTALFVVLVLLAFERFVVEFFRAKDDRLLGPFTVAQALSLAVILVLSILWKRRPITEPT